MKKAIYFILTVTILAASTFGQRLVNSEDIELRFEAVEVRHKRVGEFNHQIGMDLFVRNRLSNESQRTFYYYSDWDENIIPTGNWLRRTDEGFRWIVRMQLSETSPGIPKITIGNGGRWFIFLPGTSLEWVSADSSINAGHFSAKSIFIRESEKDNAYLEVVSTPYEIPADIVKKP
jgi:hypothetical protein